MLGEQRRTIDIDQPLQPPQMFAIERRRAANRQSDAVNRQQIVPADALEQMMRRAAGAHVVLGVDLEEIDPARAAEDVVGVLVLQAGAGGNRAQRRWTGKLESRMNSHDHPLSIGSRLWPGAGGLPRAPARMLHAGRLISVSEPEPNGVCVVVQAPLSTSFQELPW
jgi:hypothetical protein